MGKYEEYKESNFMPIGEIPSHWDISKIRSVTKLKNEKNKPNERLLSIYREYGVIYKDSRDDNHNTESEDLTNYKFVEKGNLVINKMKAWQGSLAVSKFQGIISPAYIICRVNDNIIYPKYLHYLLRSSSYIALYNSISYGVRIGQWDMRYSDFKNLPLISPPYKEQINISLYLDKTLEKIEKYIELNQDKIELLKEYKLKLIRTVTTQGIRNNSDMKSANHSWFKSIPENWDVNKVSRLFKSIGSGTTPSSGNKEYYDKGTIPWVNTGDLNDAYVMSTRNLITQVAKEENSTLKSYEKGSLIIAMYGATIGKLGILGIDATTNQACCVLNPNRYIKTKFAYYWFLGYRKNIVALSYGGGQPNISQQVIRGLKMPVPPIKEQEDIIMYLDQKVSDINEQLVRYSGQIDKIKEYKRLLISNVVTGKFDVREMVSREECEHSAN